MARQDKKSGTTTTAYERQYTYDSGRQTARADGCRIARIPLQSGDQRPVGRAVSLAGLAMSVQLGAAGALALLPSVKTLVLALDLIGTFVFALSGAAAGIRRRLDLFGVLVLSFVAATSGGIVRDLLIGATPPAAISDWRYLAVSILAGLVIFFWYPIINRLRSPVLFFDSVGLALFCVAGAQKALVFGLAPGMAALLGMLTGIGGGIARD